MAGEHALLAPSAAARWMACPASIALCEPYGDGGSSEVAAEGTAAHDVASQCLTHGIDAEFFVGQTIKADGFEFVVDQEFAAHVQVYVDAIRRLPGELFVEQKLDLSGAYDQPDQFGTGDAILLDTEALQISVNDLKFGRGVMVFAKDNPQLLSYAAAVLLEYDAIAPWETLQVAIHQPRMNHYDEYTYTVEEVHAFIERARDAAATAMLLREVEDAELLNTMAHPGTEQCRWCPHKNNCVARANYVHEAVFDDFEDVTAPVAVLGDAPLYNTKKRDVSKFSPEVLAAMLERLDIIEEFGREMRAEGHRRRIGGLPVPGWKLVQGRKGARTWKDEKAAETALKKAKLKADEMYNKKLISAPQAEKKLATAKPRVWAKLQDNIEQKDGALSLVPESDPRPEVVTSAEFEDVSNAATE